MRFLHDFKEGIQAFFKGFGFIRQHRLSHYLIYPFAITMLLWFGGIQVMQEAVDYLKSLTSTYVQLPVETLDPQSGFWQSSWESIKSLINSGSSALAGILVSLIFVILMFLVTKYVMLALLSPALALISERTEEITLGRNYPFKFGSFLKDVLRGVAVSLRNMFMETGLLIILWIVSLFLPIILPATAVLSVCITSYYFGYSMIDYIHERKRLSMSEGASQIRGMKGRAIGLGIFIVLGIQVPVIGFILAGTASLMAAVAAVLLEREDTVSMERQQTIEKTINTKKLE